MYLNYIAFFSHMGVSLTWRTEDKIRFGKCGKYLEDIVYFSLPESFEGCHPELNSHFIINDPKIVRELVGDLEVSQYLSRHAILFTRVEKLKPIDEIKAILWEMWMDFVPPSHPARYLKIEQAVEQEFYEHSLLDFRNPEYDFLWNTTNRFLRWVSQEEFKERAKLAKSLEQADKYDCGIFTRWDIISENDQHDQCKVCELAIDLNPGQKKGESYQYCYHGSSGWSFKLFFDYIAKFGDFSILTNEYSVWDEETLRNLNETRAIAEAHGLPIDDMSDAKTLVSAEEIPIDNLDLLLEELSRSRRILESTEVPAMFKYGYFQKLFEKYAQIAKKFNIPIKFG